MKTFTKVHINIPNKGYCSINIRWIAYDKLYDDDFEERCPMLSLEPPSPYMWCKLFGKALGKFKDIKDFSRGVGHEYQRYLLPLSECQKGIID